MVGFHTCVQRVGVLKMPLCTQETIYALTYYAHTCTIDLSYKFCDSLSAACLSIILLHLDLPPPPNICASSPRVLPSLSFPSLPGVFQTDPPFR